MVTKGIFKFDKNTVLDQSTIKELHDLLLKYCSVVKYEAKTKNGKCHEFVSCDELLSYDNFKKERIVELEVTGYNGHRVFTLDFYGERHSAPYIECRYRLSDPNTETLFLNDLTKFFEKREECNNHHLVSSVTIGAALFIGAFYLVLKYNLGTSAMWALALFEVITYYLIENKILKALFPPVVFCWGNETKVHHSRTTLRSNLFWAVIVSFALGILLEILL